MYGFLRFSGDVVMGKLVLVTGGARSGKSTFAESYVDKHGQVIGYIATAVAFDDGMKDRIKKHQAQRPAEWITFEKHTNIHEIIPSVAGSCDTVLLDCITVMVNNIMFERQDIDWDKVDYDTIDMIEANIQKQVEQLISELKKTELTFVMVTNELGMGIVPENRLARIYRDIAGRVNQQLSSQVDEVYFVVSGIPMKIKGD